jgi:hypothetical protein
MISGDMMFSSTKILFTTLLCYEQSVKDSPFVAFHFPPNYKPNLSEGVLPPTPIFTHDIFGLFPSSNPRQIVPLDTQITASVVTLDEMLNILMSEGQGGELRINQDSQDSTFIPINSKLLVNDQ